MVGWGGILIIEIPACVFLLGSQFKLQELFGGGGGGGGALNSTSKDHRRCERG